MEDKATIEVVIIEVQDQASCIQKGLLVDDYPNTKALEHPVKFGGLIVDAEVIREPTATAPLNCNTQPRLFGQVLLRKETVDLFGCGLAEFNSGSHERALFQSEDCLL